MTNLKKDQRADIKFCVLSGCPREETVRRIRRVYGANALSVWSIRRWYGAFQNGRVQVDDLARPGQPLKRTAAKIQHIRTVIQQDRRQTVRQVANRANLSVGTTFRVIKKDLSFKKKCAHWIPHRLTDAQRQQRVDRAHAALHFLGRGPQGQADHIVFCDESWFYAWDPASRRDNRAWLSTNAPTPAVPVREQSVPKAMLVIFFNRYGLVYCRFVPRGQGVDSQLYLEILQEMRAAFRRRRPQQWRRRRWALLHDGAPAHRALIVHQWLQQVRLPLVPHPAYSPDLNPPDYWLFAELKRKVWGELFPDV